MDYSEIQFGNFEPEFDLTPDIIGTTFQPPVKEEPSDTGLPDNFWFQNYNSFSLVRNNDRQGTIDDKLSAEIRNNGHRQTFNKAYLAAMRNRPALELERILKLTFTHEDFETNPFLRYSLYILPMIGQIFWVCWPYRTEDEAKTEHKRKTGIKPVFVIECSKCNSCQYRNSISPKKMYCSKIGLPIFKNDFNGPPPREIISHLRIAGYLKDTKPEYTWDDVRSAVIFPQKIAPSKVYDQYAPQRKEILPGAQFRRACREINKMRNDLQCRRESEKETRFLLTDCYPLIIEVQNLILKNRQNDTIANETINRIFISNERKELVKRIIEPLQKDVYLWAALRCYPLPYKNCNDLNEVRRKNNLRIPFAVSRSECGNCIENKNGFCKKLECKLVIYEEEIPEASRIQAIDFIGNDRNLNRNVIEFCKSLEKTEPKAGLKKLRETLNSNPSTPIYSGAGIQDLDKLPVKLLDGDKNIAWIVNKLENGSSILQIEREVKQAFGSKKGEAMIQEVIFSQGIIPTDRNELCLTDYTINTTTEFHKINRCGICPSSDEPYCKKYNKILVSSSIDIPAEVGEIMSFFKDQPLDIEVPIDPKRNDKPIDIEMENPGESMSVDVRIEKPLDEQKIWYEAQLQELKVETPAVVEFESPLEIEIGEMGEGMVLDDSLL